MLNSTIFASQCASQEYDFNICVLILQKLTRSGQLEPISVEDDTDCVITAYVCPLGSYKYIDVVSNTLIPPHSDLHVIFS